VAKKFATNPSNDLGAAHDRQKESTDRWSQGALATGIIFKLIFFRRMMLILCLKNTKIYLRTLNK